MNDATPTPRPDPLSVLTRLCDVVEGLLKHVDGRLPPDPSSPVRVEAVWLWRLTSAYDKPDASFEPTTAREYAHRLADRAARLAEALEAHRRFHSKVGCPGKDECSVCQLDDTLDAMLGRAGPAPQGASSDDTMCDHVGDNYEGGPTR